MLLLDYKNGVAKKNYKTRFFFATPFLRGKREKTRERPEVKNTTIFTLFFGGLTNGFLGPKISIFKIC